MNVCVYIYNLSIKKKKKICNCNHLILNEMYYLFWRRTSILLYFCTILGTTLSYLITYKVIRLGLLSSP